MLSDESKNQQIQSVETFLSDTDEDEPDKLTIVPFKASLSEQNTFINVIINSFFYKKEIMSFFETEEPPMQDSYRLIYELQSVFEQMRKLTSPIYFKKTTKSRRFIDSSYIKHELKYQFNNKFFKPNQSGKASDVLNIFYNALHVYCSGEDDIVSVQNSKCINKNCLSHTLAYVDIASQIYCDICKKKGTLYKYPLDTYYYAIDTNAVLIKLYQNIDNNYMNKLFELEILIHDETFQNNENETFVCDCRKVDKMNFKNNLIMLQSHKYFALSLLWQEPPKLEDICRVFLTLPLYWKNTDLFHVYNNFDIQEYILQGIIVVDSNNNKHVSFFINEVNEVVEYEKLEWLYCNENETKIMLSFKNVIEWCLFNNYYPSLLFYMYLNKEKIKEPKNLELSPEEINNYLHHCALVDKINSTTYTNEKLKKETLHPTLKDSYTTYDIDLINKVNEIKQDETKTMKKYNFVEELEKEKEKEAIEEETPEIEEEKNPQSDRRPITVDKYNRDKKEYFFDKGINIETFRKYPYKREGNWVCTNCENINNPSTFECVKCRLIDMGIFAKIEEEKMGRLNKKNKDKNKKNLRSGKSRSGSKKKYEYNQYTKKCLNCGNFYINNKCFRCQGKSDNCKSTFSHIRDENEMDQVKFVYNRASKTIRNSNKKKFGNERLKDWKCKNCNKKNSGNIQFCSKCKMNKY